MKKLSFFMITIAAVSLSASSALAQGTMNLAWGDYCRDPAIGALDPSIPPAQDDAPNAVFTPGWNCNSNAGGIGLKVSFKPATSMTLFAGTTVQLDAQVGTGASLPTWWDWSVTNTCGRSGVLTQANVSDDGLGSPNICSSPYGAAIQGGGGVIQNGHLGGNTLRFIGDWARADAGGPMASGTHYFAQNLQLSFTKTTGLGACSGCATPACIVLNKVIYGGDGETRDIVTTDQKSFVTFLTGTGATCPGAVPTQKRTWGQIKALYR